MLIHHSIWGYWPNHYSLANRAHGVKWNVIPPYSYPTMFFFCAMHMASYDFSSTIKNYACCAYENFIFSERFLWGNYQGVVLADHSGSICSAPWNQVMEMLKQLLRMFVPRKFHVSFVLESRSIMLHLDHGWVFRHLRNKGIHFRITKEWLSPHHSISD